MITSSNSSVKRSGLPNQFLGVVQRTIHTYLLAGPGTAKPFCVPAMRQPLFLELSGVGIVRLLSPMGHPPSHWNVRGVTYFCGFGGHIFRLAWPDLVEGITMYGSKPTTHRPVVTERCTLAHQLNNDLAIIVGNCDLLAELLKGDPLWLERVKAIKATAWLMADRVEARLCPAVSQERSPVSRS
jgi:hypothetical protein